MAEPIKMTPEDNTFPKDWPGINEFIRLFTVGGDLAMSPPQTIKGEDGERQSVLVYHMDRGDKFQVTRLDGDTYAVFRLPRQ